MLPKLIFVTCNPAPTMHFMALGQAVNSKSIEAQPERKKKVLEGLGIQPNWAENFEKGLQTIVSNQ